MKPRLANQRKRAFTWIETLVVIAVLLMLAVMFLPILAAAKRRAQLTNCTSNLREVGFSYSLWARDHNNQYPMSVSVANGGGMELLATGNVAGYFLIMSNYLATPKILNCPADNREEAPVFTPNPIYPNSRLNNSNISYFVGLDADKTRPQTFLSGDDNFAIGDGTHPHPPDAAAVGNIPVKSGLLELSSNAPIWWTETRHEIVGNIAFSDGSVQRIYIDEVQQALQKTGLATNRLVIP